MYIRFPLSVLITFFAVTPLSSAAPADDLELARVVAERLLHSEQVDASKMVISSFNGVVHLSGVVASLEDFKDIQAIVLGVNGVKRIESDVTAVFRSKYRRDPWGM